MVLENAIFLGFTCPPFHIYRSPENEENYDDVEFVSQGKMHTF